MPAANLRLRFFGTFAIEIAEVPAEGVPKPAQELLARLAAAKSRSVDRIEIASAIWPQATPDRARFYLRRCLTQLRTILGSQSWRLGSDGERRLSLDLSDCSCDLLELESSRGQSYSGDFLTGHESDWVRQTREGYRDLFIRLQYQLAVTTEANDEFDTARKALDQAIRADPCREESYRLLMGLLHRRGEYSAVAHVFRDLRVSLRRGVGLSPSRETSDLYRDLLAKAQISPPARPDQIPDEGAKLPSPVGPFIGRQAEQAELGRWIMESRLVTVTGLGGVGKSRLAVQVAASLAGHFSGGVAFVDLAACRSSEDVAGHLNHSLAGPETGGMGRRLLCFDSAEHVAAECRRILEGLLADSPSVHVLCTSRVPLHIPAERVLCLEPMSVPHSLTDDVQSVLAVESVQFILACAKRVAPAFAVTPDNVEALKELCIRLDGIPLALELAAVRLRSLPIREIVANLDDRFRLLDRGGSNHETRRTLGGVLDWSFNLLSATEQALLVRLGVFSSTWSLSAVQAVCSDDDLQAKQIPQVLANLVDHSLVVYDLASGGRYRMLETVRAYVREQLTSAPDLQKSLHAHHADFYYQSAADPQASVADIPNFMAAADHLLGDERPECSDAGLRLINRLFPVWYRGGAVSNALAFSISAIDSFGDYRSEAMTETLFRAAGAAHLLFKIDLADELFARAEEMGDALGLDEWSAELLLGRGELAANDGRLDDACRLLTAALERFRIAGDLTRQATCLRMLGYAKRENQVFEQAEKLTHDALAIYTKTDDTEGRLWCLGSLAAIHLAADAPDRAAPLLLQTLELQEHFGNSGGEAWNRTMLGITYARLKDYAAAETYLRQAIDLHEREDENLSRSWPLQELGELFRTTGRLDDARTALTTALGLCRSSGSTALEVRALIRLCVIAIEQQDLASASAYRDVAAELLATIQAPEMVRDLERATNRLRAATDLLAR